MNKIKCFIACSFGKVEIDNLYENAIKKALVQLDIKGLRVDKINHNEKIDLKIIGLIKEADFGIADLTYARPSVYFEAGLLEGQNKQVIYLGRKDHFEPKIDDLNGNLKIHFDLITKNIISWDNINPKLVNEIKKRVNLVIRPIQSAIKLETNLKIAKQSFNSLSIENRIEKLNQVAFEFIETNFKTFRIVKRNYHAISISANLNKRDYHIILLIVDSFKKKTLIGYSPYGDAWMFMSDNEVLKIKNRVIYFISLRAMRTMTIDSSLNTCSKVEDKLYTYTLMDLFTFKYFILDKIETESDLLNKLNGSLKKLKSSS